MDLILAFNKIIIKYNIRFCMIIDYYEDANDADDDCCCCCCFATAQISNNKSFSIRHIRISTVDMRVTNDCFIRIWFWCIWLTNDQSIAARAQEKNAKFRLDIEYVFNLKFNNSDTFQPPSNTLRLTVGSWILCWFCVDIREKIINKSHDRHT